ncbi:MAG: ATP-binding protein [Oribacterium sp.]|nr:ATP-binding protein [Oribacterium sp.]
MFCHPVFITAKPDQTDSMMVTATSYVGTDELSNVIAFPKKSLQGIPVVAGVSFGREPYSLNPIENDLYIGNSYHLHEEIKNQKIEISTKELSKHTFITGSTGSGKSNTIYWMLEKLVNKQKKFMVIEPAKGEYKSIIGQNDKVCVYGTNPLKRDSKLLKINPFSFPVEEIHILEHLDRLVEIFNVCWPMYAAMPAILKDSIERAYMVAGWNLSTSENKYGFPLFPTFGDVMIQTRKVLEESDYSNDNKGDYVGALVTRIKSLTNGINGLIFCSEEIDGKDLFDENVIVDLSRIGSTETKSLIMGLLILKLQEYRMQNSNPDTELWHVTVLEEAHNILKRTSSEQSMDSANLLGKSVEMLSNAIAEMRTYGEGFIIADQSPGLLDLSVIRNTNTKILMRLPEYEDRLLVGKASGLNDAQIDELGRLEMGVASVHQSGWIEPVLCKIVDYKSQGEILKGDCNKKREDEPLENESSKSDRKLIDLLMKKEIYRKCDRTDIDSLRSTIISSGLDATVKAEFLEYLSHDGEKAVDKLRSLAYDFFNASEAFERNKDTTNDFHEWIKGVVSSLSPSVDEYSNQAVNIVISLIMYEHARRNVQYKPHLLRFTEEYMLRGRVV